MRTDLQMAEDSADINFDRYEPCYVPCTDRLETVIWLEGLLVLHDSEIQLQSLETLGSAGYEEASSNARFESKLKYAERGR